MNGRTLFKCTRCDHSVTTLEFQSTNGNRRTQSSDGNQPTRRRCSYATNADSIDPLAFLAPKARTTLHETLK